MAAPTITNVVRRNLGSSDARVEYANAASIVNNGPNNSVGKLYPTDSEALHASNSAINTTGILLSSRIATLEMQYRATPSTIPKTPKDTTARLPRYSPTAMKNAGITISIDAPAYLGTLLARTSDAALAFSRNIEPYPASTPSNVPKFR